MKVFKSKEKVIRLLDRFRSDDLKIGFVPTMGALHSGHLSLIQSGFHDNDIMVVSIFVNPTQFNNNKDLKEYPRSLIMDVDLLETITDKDIVIFAPSVEDIYGAEIISDKYSFDGLEDDMEGHYREGHFDGVATVVNRLLEIIKPHAAYFGEKDFQQLQIIKTLVRKKNIPVNIVGCEIYREPSGLAMSSRNERLEPEYKKAAPFIYQTLLKAKKKFAKESAKKVTTWVKNQFKNHDLLRLEYFVIAEAATLKPIKNKSKNRDYRAFAAVYAKDIRLIDNIALN